MLPRAGQVCHLISSCVHLSLNVTQTYFSIYNTEFAGTVMATSTEMSLLRSSAALVNLSQMKRLMSCLKMETRTTMACWTLMVWWFINSISFYSWACMNSDQVLKQHPCPFPPRIPQDDGERAVKQRLRDIPLPSHPCQQEPLPLNATQIHFPLCPISASISPLQQTDR